MAIPEEIRRVARPRNTVVVLSGTKGAKRYAVRERAGYKYALLDPAAEINSLEQVFIIIEYTTESVTPAATTAAQGARSGPTAPQRRRSPYQH